MTITLEMPRWYLWVSGVAAAVWYYLSVAPIAARLWEMLQ